MPAATIDESHSTGAPAASAARVAVDDVVGVGDVLGDVDLPAGVDQAHHDARHVVGEARSGRPRRGSSRTTAGRSRRRRGCSRAPAHPTGWRWRLVAVRGGHQHLARRAGCRRRVRSRRSAGGTPTDCPGGCRGASRRTSAAECAQPGLPVHALTVEPRRVLVEDQALSGASTRSATSATPSSRSQTSTERHGVITSGASIAARYSATVRLQHARAARRRPSVTRPSSCSIQPTGGRGSRRPRRARLRGAVKPGSQQC